MGGEKPVRAHKYTNEITQSYCFPHSQPPEASTTVVDNPFHYSSSIVIMAPLISSGTPVIWLRGVRRRLSYRKAGHNLRTFFHFRLALTHILSVFLESHYGHCGSLCQAPDWATAQVQTMAGAHVHITVVISNGRILR